MAVFGTKEEGFEISADTPSRYLVLRAWGFWKKETGALFHQEMRKSFFKFMGGTWGLLADFTSFKTQSPEVYKKLVETMASLKQSGMTRVAVVVKDAISRLQSRHLADECGKEGWTFHVDVAGARLALSGAK